MLGYHDHYQACRLESRPTYQSEHINKLQAVAFCSFPKLHFMARMLNKSCNEDMFGLHQLDLHRWIEQVSHLLVAGRNSGLERSVST